MAKRRGWGPVTGSRPARHLGSPAPTCPVSLARTRHNVSPGHLVLLRLWLGIPEDHEVAAQFMLARPARTKGVTTMQLPHIPHPLTPVCAAEDSSAGTWSISLCSSRICEVPLGLAGGSFRNSHRLKLVQRTPFASARPQEHPFGRRIGANDAVRNWAWDVL